MVLHKTLCGGLVGLSDLLKLGLAQLTCKSRRTEASNLKLDLQDLEKSPYIRDSQDPGDSLYIRDKDPQDP